MARHPRFPSLALPERLRAWIASPAERALREKAKRLARPKLDPDASRPKPKRKRRKSGSTALSAAQIERGEIERRRLLREDPPLAKNANKLADAIRRRLKLQCSVDTVRRHIVEKAK